MIDVTKHGWKEPSPEFKALHKYSQGRYMLPQEKAAYLAGYEQAKYDALWQAKVEKDKMTEAAYLGLPRHPVTGVYLTRQS